MGPSDEFRKTSGMIVEAVREVRGAAFDVAHGGNDKEVNHEIVELRLAAVDLVRTISQVISWAKGHVAEDAVAEREEQQQALANASVSAEDAAQQAKSQRREL